MQYGTGVSEQEWQQLMDHARNMATILGKRISVKAFILDGRMKKFYGRDYHYLAMFPEVMGIRRCGTIGPNGKPCIRYKWKCDQYSGYHVSRTSNKNERLAWGANFPTQTAYDNNWIGDLA